MHRGFAVLWRKFENEPVFQNDGVWKLWCWLLMHVNYERKTIAVTVGRGVTSVTLEAGQRLVGRHSLAKTLNMKPSTIRNRLHFLERHGYIAIQKDRHYSIVTICDWNTWHKYLKSKGTTKGTTEGQPKDTEYSLWKTILTAATSGEELRC